MYGFEITERFNIEGNITFIRINPTDIALTLREVFLSISDISWISSFDEDYIRKGFTVRSENTIKYISENIIKSTDDSVTSDSGEYVVSELSRKAIISELGYYDIPLAELIKIKDVGNHGFDFYTINNDEILLFGEAKYNSRQNAYGSALEQIVRFESKKQDCSDIIDIDRFCSDAAKQNHADSRKGFIASFSTKQTPTDKLIKSLIENQHFQALRGFDELICVSVNL